MTPRPAAFESQRQRTARLIQGVGVIVASLLHRDLPTAYVLAALLLTAVFTRLLGGRFWAGAIVATGLVVAFVAPASSPMWTPEQAVQRLTRGLVSAERDLKSSTSRVAAILAGDRSARAAFDAIEFGRQPNVAISIYADDLLIAWGGQPALFADASLRPGLAVTTAGSEPLLLWTESTADVEIVAELRLDDIVSPIDHVEWYDDTETPPSTAMSVNSPAGTHLATVAVRANSTHVRSIRAQLGPISLAALLLALAMSAARTRDTAMTMLACSLVVAARLVLRSLAATSSMLFGPAALATVAPLHLLSSPVDLLLTGLTSVLLAGLLATMRLRLVPSTTTALGLLTVVALTTGAGVSTLVQTVRRLSDNSDVDLGDFSVIPLDAVRLAAVAGLVGLVIALVLLALVTCRACCRLLARAGEPLAAPWLAALTWSTIGTLGAHVSMSADLASPGLASAGLFALPLVAALLLERFTSPAAQWRIAAATALIAVVCLHLMAAFHERRALRSFLRHDVATTLRRHDANIRWLLDSVLLDIRGALADELVDRDPDEVAYRVWKMTRLQREPYRVAVDVVGPRGDFARFAYRLPLPIDARDVQPGSVTLQEVLFHGRMMRVLAGGTRLEDGTRLTVRIGEDQRVFPYFLEMHPLRGALQAQGARHLRPLVRAEAELTVVDAAGQVLQSSAPPAFPVARDIVDRANTESEPFWWSTRVEGHSFEALTFRSADKVLTVSMPTSTLSARAAALLHVVIFVVIVLIAMLAAAGIFSPHWRGRWPNRTWIRRSYQRKMSFALGIGTIAPALLFALFLRSTIETQKLQELRKETLTALELARRILAELLVNEPLTTLDDSTLIWVAETVGHDLAIFEGPDLAATSMRDLFRDGLLSTRVSGRAFRAINVEGAPSHVTDVRLHDVISLQGTTRLGDDGLLTLYSVSHRSDIVRAAADRSRLLFLATAVLVFVAAIIVRVVARRTTAPVRALTEATARIAAGDLDVLISSDRQDEIRRLVESFNSMTTRLSAQREELRARAEYLKQLLDNATTGVISTDADRRVTTINPAASRILGIATTIGAPLESLLRDAGLDALTAPLAESRSAELEFEVPATPEPRTIHVILLPLMLAGSTDPGRLVLLEDVSQIVKSKKLEAWAEMARRIAHEIKNPLTPIRLASEHSLRLLDDRRHGWDSALRGCIDTTLRQVDDLRQIAREFSAYAAGPRPVEREHVDVVSWASELLDAYRGAPGIELVLDVDPDCGAAWMDPARMRRALINLLENALQAMPGGGRLALHARRLDSGDIEIKVADNGVGIPDELRDKLFDPYFSTKDAGTGLGLANAKRTVEDHGGRIEVDSSPGGGTTVVLYLPPRRP